ncbi:MAG: hydrogenase small subunit [Chloroflexota bacterium]
MPEKTIYQDARKAGLSRRDFLKLSGMLAATLGLNTMPPIAESGLPLKMGEFSRTEALITKAMESKPRLPVIWLEFQDCTGCTEAVSRANAPTLSNLVLNTLTIEYHETLSAAAGYQVEEAKQQAMKKYAGQYILVVEGSIPVGDEALYCVIGGRTGEEILKEAAAGAAAIIAVGNCSSFGGLPKAKPNPTNAKGVWEIITDKPVVNIPGCPAIPEATVGVIAHFALFGALPELDGLHRPKTFYGVTVHDRCLRRPFYEAGKFANSFDDEGAKKGHCLYKLGCKGPTTYNSCATIKWDTGLSFPIQSGHPCLGCSQPDFWDGGGFYQGQSAPLERPEITAVGAAVAAGAVIGAGVAISNNTQKKALEAPKGGSK